MILLYEEAIRAGFKIIKEWRKPHKPCDLNTPDCGAECVLYRNQTKRKKLNK